MVSNALLKSNRTRHPILARHQWQAAGHLWFAVWRSLYCEQICMQTGTCRGDWVVTCSCSWDDATFSSTWTRKARFKIGLASSGSQCNVGFFRIGVTKAGFIDAGTVAVTGLLIKSAIMGAIVTESCLFSHAGTGSRSQLWLGALLMTLATSEAWSGLSDASGIPVMILFCWYPSGEDA